MTLDVNAMLRLGDLIMRLNATHIQEKKNVNAHSIFTLTLHEWNFIKMISSLKKAKSTPRNALLNSTVNISPER